jgi:hypothetical protein
MYAVAVMPVLLAAGWRLGQGLVLRADQLLLFLLAAVLLLAWENLANDVFDADTGVDTHGKPHSVVNLTGRRDRVLALANGCLLLGLALMALVALMLAGIIELADIGTAVNWDIIHFFGVVIGLSVMFNAAGVSEWAKPILAPAILHLADSPLTLLLALTLILWLIRFVDVAWGFTTVALLAPLLIPLHQQFDLHPALLRVAFIAAGNSFFLAYQQPFIITAESMMQTRGWSSRQVSKAGILFAISALMGIAASTIYWRAMGLMPG